MTTLAGADSTHAPLPNIEIRFALVYAWMTIGFGVIFFLPGLFIAPLGHHRNVGFGLVICLVSVPAVIGANYWRKHLHIVAQMTPRQLVLRRDGPIDWDNIAAIDWRRCGHVAVQNGGMRMTRAIVLLRYCRDEVRDAIEISAGSSNLG